MTTIVVSIAHKTNVIPLENKVLLEVGEDETPIQVAKKFRKETLEKANKKGFYLKNPAELAWAIFNKVEDREPIETSANWNKKLFLNNLETSLL